MVDKTKPGEEGNGEGKNSSRPICGGLQKRESRAGGEWKKSVTV